MKLIDLHAADLEQGGKFFKFNTECYRNLNFPDARDATPNEPVVVMGKWDVRGIIDKVVHDTEPYLPEHREAHKDRVIRDRVITGLATLNGWRYLAFTGQQVILVAVVEIVKQ